MSTLLKIYFFIFLIVVAATASVVFASSQGQITGLQGGEGSSEISGWVVSNVHYQLAENDPTKVMGVQVELSGPAGMVQVKGSSDQENFAVCQNITGNIWLCNFFSPLSLSEMDQLRVIALN